MGILEAVQGGKEKQKRAWLNQKQKRRTRPLTANGVLQVFKDSFEDKYGAFQLVTEKEWQMLKGFVKVCQTNEKEAEIIYSQIIDIVNKWEELRVMPTNSLKGVIVTLPFRPSLMMIFTCRDSLFLNLEQIKKQDEMVYQRASTVKTADRKKVRILKTPTQQDIDKEYQDEYA